MMARSLKQILLGKNGKVESRTRAAQDRLDAAIARIDAATERMQALVCDVETKVEKIITKKPEGHNGNSTG